MIDDEINICDDEKTEFLSISNNYSKCYVCLNYTLLLSPCKCKTPICNDCFISVVKKNGKNCTICKNEFNKNSKDNCDKSMKKIHNIIGKSTLRDTKLNKILNK